MTTQVEEPPTLDRHDSALVQNVHPPDWKNPEASGRYNLVVIGGGTAGLVCAAGAALLGAKVALIEKHYLGGDCLNTGCVPSKALIRAARAAHETRRGSRFGVHVRGDVDVDFADVMERVREVRTQISHHDSVQRFQNLGVQIFFGEAHFSGVDTIEVDGETLRFKKAVIATGTRPAIPAIKGLDRVEYLTNESVFGLSALPPRLAVLGGGPIGCELAQAFRRLGSSVSIVEQANQLLPREDAECSAVIHEVFKEEHIDMRLGVAPSRVESTGRFLRIYMGGGESKKSIDVDAILVAAGRTPNVENLRLDIANVAFDSIRGVVVDDYLRTSNPNVYAAGDVCMTRKFTHAADAAARIVLRNALFGFAGRKRVSALTIPWCTYTDPEVAHVGLTEKEAASRGILIETYSVQSDQADRALTDNSPPGRLRIHCKLDSGKILGATWIGRNAGDLIGELGAAIALGIPLGKLGSAIRPYPTNAELINRAADQFNLGRLTPAKRRLLRGLLSWQRR